MAGFRTWKAGWALGLVLVSAHIVEGHSAPPGVAAAVVGASERIADQTAPQVGLPPPGTFAGPDAHAAWFEVTGGGTMQRHLGLRLAELWTSEPWRGLLRIGITLAVLLAVARLLWRQAVEGQVAVPGLAALILKLLLGYLIVYQPAWIYGLARALQASLLAAVAVAWSGAEPRDAPAGLVAERLAVQRGVLEAVAARQPVIMDDAAAGGSEAALAAHEAWLQQRGLGPGPPPADTPAPEDPGEAGRLRAQRLREIAWAHAHWLGPPQERLNLTGDGAFAGVAGVVPLGRRLDAIRSAWELAAVGSGELAAKAHDPAETLALLRADVRAETIRFLDEALLQPALQRSLLEGARDALDSWARHVAARIGRAASTVTGLRTVAERISEGLAGAVTLALGWIAAIGGQLVLELAVGAVLLAFPLSFVPGFEGVLGAAWRALLRPVLWLPAYALLAAAVDGAMGRWLAEWTEVPVEAATWGSAAMGYVLPAISPLLASVAMGIHLLLHLGALVLVTLWSGRWVGGVTGVAGMAGGLLTAGIAGLLHRAGWVGTGRHGGGLDGSSATPRTGAGDGPASVQTAPERRPVPWRGGGEEAMAQFAWKGSLSWNRGRPQVTWAAAAAGFRRRWSGPEAGTAGPG